MGEDLELESAGHESVAMMTWGFIVSLPWFRALSHYGQLAALTEPH